MSRPLCDGEDGHVCGRTVLPGWYDVPVGAGDLPWLQARSFQCMTNARACRAHAESACRERMPRAHAESACRERMLQQAQVVRLYYERRHLRKHLRAVLPVPAAGLLPGLVQKRHAAVLLLQ